MVAWSIHALLQSPLPLPLPPATAVTPTPPPLSCNLDGEKFCCWLAGSFFKNFFRSQLRGMDDLGLTFKWDRE